MGRTQESLDALTALRQVVHAAPIGGTLLLFLTAAPVRVTAEIRNNLASFLNEP